MNERMIFLDVDGVLNNIATRERSNNGMIGIDPVKVQLLKEIKDQTGARIVLTSTWRNEWEPDYESCGLDGKYLSDSLTSGGVEIHDRIPGLSGIHRGSEIRRYAKTEPTPQIVQDFLLKAVEHYCRYLERQKDKGDR